MWESRVLGEISKFLWEPFCGFHRNVISTALFMPGRLPIPCAIGGYHTLRDSPIVVPSAVVISIWFVPAGEDVLRFVTAYPGDAT
jgi:hypothetical protein